IDGQPELAAKPTESAAEGKARHAGRRVDAKRGGQPETLRLLIEVAERSAGFHARDAPSRINPNTAHQREVEQKTSFAYGIPRNVVAAGAHRDQNTMLTRESDGAHDVRGASATVDHRIPNRASLIVAGLLGQTNNASQRLSQGVESVVSKHNRPSTLQRAQLDLGHGFFSRGTEMRSGKRRLRSPA